LNSNRILKASKSKFRGLAIRLRSFQVP
jgi:hypothetical protein